jgi:hypothetical protein
MSPAQQRLERLPDSVFGCAGRVDGPPAHKAVRPHQHGAGRRDPVRPGEAALRGRPALFPPPRARRGPPRAGRPRPAPRPARQRPRPRPAARNSGRTGPAWTACCRRGRGRRAARAPPAGPRTRGGARAAAGFPARAPRRGVVAVPDLHREVVHDRLRVLRSQVGGHPRDVPGERLLDGELPTGRRSASYVSSNPGPATPPRVSASFQARLCASCTPVLPP